MIIKVKNFINSVLFKLGYRVSKINNSHELFKIHKYDNYDDYKNTQIFYNKKKIDHVWADEENLIKICDFIKKNISKDSIKGICHGSRNGFEQKIIQKNIKNSKVTGTDISDNATKFENTFFWDFHEEKKEWFSFFDFVYTNSLDQSYNPKKALETWLNQINRNGYIFIEHSEQHGVLASNKMDPFGVEANFFPYLLSDWFGHKISISIIKSIKKKKSNSPVWFFILKKI